MAIRIVHHRSLAPLTTLEVGGVAERYIKATSESQIIEALWYAQREQLGVTVLGGGSNSLIADSGLSGLVLQPLEVAV